MRLRAAGLGTGCLLMLAACDGGGDPVQQALRETAAANHSAVVKETATATPAPAPAQTADETRVAALIADNNAALARAQAVLRDSQDPELRRLAQATIEARLQETANLQAWTPKPAVTE